MKKIVVCFIFGLISFLALRAFINSKYKVPAAYWTDENVLKMAESKNKNLQDILNFLISPSERMQDRTTARTLRLPSSPEQILYDLAPIIWWHPEEKFKAEDPLQFIEQSELISWKKEFLPFTSDRQVLIPLGKVHPEDLKKYSSELWRPHESIGRAEGDEGVALNRVQKMPEILSAENVPLFWRLSRHPQISKLFDTDENSAVVLLEYWYHLPNNPIKFYFGSHQGDWESFAFLILLSTDSTLKDAVSYQVLAAYLSAHGRGQWFCPDQLQKNDSHGGRYEFFSALGTHATYAHAGKGQMGFINDRTERGEAWATWKNLQPLQLESYYGYTGAWGNVSDLHWSMTGPMPPSPHFKYLPKGTEISFNPASDCR